MKIKYPETELPPIGFFARHSLSGVAEPMKRPLATDHVHENKLSYWQLIFIQSKANGCSHYGEDLPQVNWEWPKNTWFQERSQHLKGLEFALQRGS
jgi:hypothetical protein